MYREWPWADIPSNLRDVEDNKSKNVLQSMVRKAINVVIGPHGHYGHGSNPAWRKKVISLLILFVNINLNQIQVAVCKLQSKASRGLAALVGKETVSPADFVEWENMKLTRKHGTDFSSGPLKEHLKNGAKWLPLKVFDINYRAYQTSCLICCFLFRRLFTNIMR